MMRPFHQMLSDWIGQLALMNVVVIFTC